MSLKYTSLLGFNKFLGMDAEIPVLVEGSSPTLENIGTGDGSTLVFYFDQKYPIENSETLYTGSSAVSACSVALVRGTDYTVDYDKSKITLTSASVITSGALLVGEYCYNKFGIKNSSISPALYAAESQVDQDVNTVFTDNTSSAPLFTNVLNEVMEGGGEISTIYHSQFYPLNPAQAIVSGAISVGASTITVTGSTNGFPNSGYLGVGTNKAQYTGKTSNSFTGVTSIASAISDQTKVTNWVVERSITSEGTSPTWEVLDFESDYDLDHDSGEFKLNKNTVIGNLIFDTSQPPQRVWNRVRITYNYGYDTTPQDVVRLVYLLAAKELYNRQVLNALGRGTNGFTSDALSNSDAWIQDTIQKYKCMKCSNLN